MVLEKIRAPGGTKIIGLPGKGQGGEIRFLLACAGLAMVAALPAFAGDYEEGLRFHQDRNFAQSLELFRRAAEQGDGRAQFSLAYMYGSGQGVSQDYLEAHRWALAAAANGQEQAKDFRALLEKYMPPEQLEQALARARRAADAPVPVPAPAIVPATDPTPARVATSVPRDVSDALETWRAAWSRRDGAAYLAAYAPDFKLPQGQTRARWEAQRHERLKRASRIEVRAENPEIILAPDGSATARFTQVYASNRRRETVNKTLVFANYGGTWLIREETSTP